ncbi:hypothetical protein MPTK1_2g16160 [Marchantia polymorpha subsp. ruderalis]|uniref:Essential protein Yae1 N-terminal domain-containing protein n=2 Tax=Marchantia polymorpha TaxID=3197 RepID=A0A176VVP2_MARPO|nr:hypothetical protein AXG93_4343s1290 [Marchantia polymorpha subsp. ruderalis]PTQ30621.1 hypothetical protein MARPO_0122s0047 [Marchantia polymorpha]BBN02547.1 hypothetical protein Mp_2g16160 [Marchantia polymorpha subsp. ruderalis]|eukprot:PTQ30621.1 hypothetical protein MARPO_0122s0047 [Marchantia polymorpha]
MGSSESESREFEDDVWGADDDDAGVVGRSSQTDADLAREWEARRNQFHTLGYRDGISAGKESKAQEGFNVGFEEAVVAGYNWGLARGATSAFAALSPALKESLLTDKDATNRLESLNTSISSISSTDAMRIFYEETILRKGTTGSQEGVQIVTTENSNIVIASPQTESTSSGCCGGREDCDMQRLSLEPEAEKATRSGKTFEAGTSCTSSGSPGDASTTDEKEKADFSCADASNKMVSDLNSAQNVDTYDMNSLSRPRNRLELLQGKVEIEFKPFVVKLSPFPV